MGWIGVTEVVAAGLLALAVAAVALLRHERTVRRRFRILADIAAARSISASSSGAVLMSSSPCTAME